MVWNATPRSAPHRLRDFSLAPPDSGENAKLKYPIKDKKPYEATGKRNPFDLADPAVFKEKYTLDSEKYRYDKSSKIGDLDFKLPASSSISEQLKATADKNNSDYFRSRAQAQNFAKGGGILPQINVGNKVVDKIFGNGIIDIRPRGTAEIIFAGNFNTVRNPAFSLRQQKTGQFDFKQKIQLNVTGQVGDKLKVNMNYDTEATFEFENQMKLDFAGKEDDIIKKIELGNVSLPLNSSLIQGSSSLFGVKTTMQFGKLTVTGVVSQQRGKTQETELAGGTTTTPFNIQCDGYDMNRHYFLAHYFRDNYEGWLKNLPFVGSPVVITRVEVWVTNRSGSFEQSRDVVGFTDMGEGKHLDNKYWKVNAGIELGSGVNNLYDANNANTYLNGYGNPALAANYRASYKIENKLSEEFATTNLKPISQYQIINFARQLGPNEFTFNARLGYVSLNQALNNDDVLCVAYEGTVNGIPFKVGDFSMDIPRNTDNPEVLFLKMLKGPSLRPDLPIWDLMMKNVYSLGSFQIQSKDFKLNLVYADDPSGSDLNYLPVRNEPALSNLPLLNVFGLDKMNTQQEAVSDGLFDYVEGITVNSQTGRVFLPTVEPFGKYLQTKFSTDPNLANYYCFFALYDSTRFSAVQQPQYNKFFLRGSYQGSSTNEISLGSTNVPRGSVKVTSNGAPLTENSDYIVDYNLGRVKIVNSALLNSGAVIKVSSESNNLFQIQQKSLLGARFDYKYSPALVLGSTFMYLNERPLTPKVNIGEEPISNMIVGVDGTFTKQSNFLTRLVDKLPFIETKEPSNVTISGEYARLIPGVQKSLSQKGTAYLDDFEGAETPFDLRMGNTWALASTPQGQPDNFPEGNSLNKLEYGFKRANLAWYTIATTFYRNDAFTPAHLKQDPASLSTHATREVLQQDVFKNKQIQQGLPTTLPTFDISFYPSEKGPYNFNTSDLNADGTLKNPSTNWGGIMRKIDQNDFEQANIDYIEMWVMDPFADKPASVDRGYLYLNLGNISEDILRDNRRSAENGLPKNDNADQLAQVDTTVWGRVPRAPVINYAFDADANVRKNQDIGIDGLNDDGERSYFDEPYVKQVLTKFGPTSTAYLNATKDPANDNYHYYLGNDYDTDKVGLLDRYKKYNRHQGNSPTIDQSPNGENYPTAATNVPDNEDLNRDYTVNGVEEYFQYKVEIARDAFIIGRNFVTDTLTTSAKFINGDYAQEKWYQLKIPVREFERKVGEINDFKSIRFIRMYMRGFNEPITMRLATLQLVRADWRKYLNNLEAGGEHKPVDPTDNTQFVVSTVNIEKNGQRKPIIYAVPPGIQREIDFSSPTSIQQNEQSLSLLACNLKDGDARGVFKSTNVDLRQYGKLRLFVHAEGTNLKNDELTAFFRFGTDLTNNYYEFEIPLQVTPSEASDPAVIWPSANEMTILLEEMINTKIARTNSGIAFSAPYSRQVGNATYTVVGMPDYSQLRMMMMGVRNPKRRPGSTTDDGLPKCAEVWFNELRMTDFNTVGGDAATGRVLAKLADFGSVQLSGSYKSVGWGGIDKKLIERSMADNYIYDVQTNFELGKFFPKTSGISLPFFFSYGNTIIRPYYNPLNPDTKLQKEINETTNPERSDQISRAADDYTARKSFNFTNVRKNRVGAKRAYPWDVENFAFTYSYTELLKRNQTLEYNNIKNYKGMITYNYNFVNKPFEPFKKIKNKNLEIIKDFNLNYLPAGWGVRLEADRRYGELLNRNNDSRETALPVLYDKMFTMRRYYEFRYDVTRNLKLDFNATADARVDEPAGKIGPTTPDKQDSIKQNFWKGGRTTKYDQTARFNYNIPIGKLPYMSWVSQLSYNYTANFQWLQAPPAADSLGNTIQNSQQQQWNLNLNFVQFYNKFGIYRKITNPKQASQPKPKKKPADSKDGLNAKPEKEENTRDKYPMWVVVPVKLLTMVKNAGGTYSTTRGTAMPGFYPKPQYLGQNYDNGGPGFDFIFGMQDPNFRFKAADNGWISKDPRIVNPYIQNYQEAITARALIEPIEDFRIEFNASKNYSRNLTAYFRYDPDSNGGMYRDFGTPIEQGSYSISYSVIRTAFSKEDGNGVSEVFKQFEANRIEIARRLAAQKGVAVPTDTFPSGYGPYQQDVLIPAFLAAYRGVDAKTVSLSPFQNFPIPNWKVTYNGLSKLALVKEFASNVNIQSSYQSTYNVAGFQTVMDTARNTTISNDFAPAYVIRQISIVERFGPLIGIDITLVNNVTTSFKYNQDRTMNFALGNRQLNEQNGKEYVFGIGYRTNKLVLPITSGGRRIKLKNDINFRFDFSIRENVTKVRNLDRPTNDPVSGQNVLSIKPTIDYMINEKLMLRIFYDRRRTNPYTSNSFPTIITSGGFSIRYTIQ
ncbi:MAG: cell surface protein SprA [Bacteroidetes bacterium B1(2017)]|nr:MAG: cell surface protein SprA [Bacteroidetes bacterium B1(2017)]